MGIPAIFLVFLGAGIGALVAAPVTLLGLGMAGFSILGPVAGTFAAAAQAGIGNVAAGSLFAFAQSVAMTGAVPAFITTIGGVLGAIAGVLAALF